MSSTLTTRADAIAGRAVDDLRALVDVSTPSGDRNGIEAAVAAAVALVPPMAAVDRLPCSSQGYAPDLLLALAGTGRSRVLLLGHLDTVIAHDAHRALAVHGDRLDGSGTIDMKGGDVLALGVFRDLAATPWRYAAVDLLLVSDEEWRIGDFAHVDRFAGYDACLCFEAGERDADGNEAVIVQRKAAGTLRVDAHGRSAHAGAHPEDGRNALLALSTLAGALAALNAPNGDDALTVVPTILRCGEALNVLPGVGELWCDVRAHHMDGMRPVLDAIAPERDGVALTAALTQRWPGMDTREATAGVLADASQRLGRPIMAHGRGGASDASHFSKAIPISIDGLGPLGAGSHAPDEHALASSFGPRAEVALAIVDAIVDS